MSSICEEQRCGFWTVVMMLGLIHSDQYLKNYANKLSAYCCTKRYKLITAGTRFSETLKGNSGIFKPRPYFWHEIRSSTHREQFGESRRPSEDI